MTLNSLDLEYLRDNHPHKTSLYLSVYIPSTVYVCTVDGDHDRGSSVIAVNDLSGNINNVEGGMTAIVGTDVVNSLGNRRRVRSFAPGFLRFDENEDIWEDGTIIVVLRIRELWPVYPKYSESANTFFKDGDVSYSDQNEEPTPVAIIKNNHNVLLKTGAMVSELFDGTDSYVIASGATITNYLWESTAGTIISPTSSTTYIDFSSTYKDGVEIKLTVTDSNGKTQSTYRYLFVVDLNGTELQRPYTDFSLSAPITGSWQSGGWRTNITVYGDATQNIFPEFTYNTLVILWQRVRYNLAEAQVDDRPLTLLVGYVVSESIVFDARTQTTTFELETINSMMSNRSNMFSVSLEDVANPTDWYQYKNLTLGRAVHHFWKYHSTLLDITNVFIPNITAPKMYATDDFQGTNLFDNVNTFTRDHGNFSHVVCDKYGQIHLEQNINMIDETARDAVEEAMTLTDQDIREFPSIVRRRVRASYIVLGDGTSYDGTNYTPLISKAPGETPYVDGSSPVTLSRLALNSQAELNSYTGRRAAIDNDIIQELRLDLAGNYSFIDVVPQRWFLHSIDSSENNRGISYTNNRFVPRTITLTHSPDTGVMQTNVIFEHESVGPDGITGDYPTDIPTITPPPPPPVITPPPPPTIGDGFGTVYVAASYRLYRTRDFSAASPVYTTLWDDPTNTVSIGDFILDPWQPESRAWQTTSLGVVRFTSLETESPSYEYVLTDSDIFSALGLTSISYMHKISASINLNGYIATVFRGANGSSSRGLYCAYSYDGGDTWSFSTIVSRSGTSSYEYTGGLDYVPHLVGGQVVLYVSYGDGDTKVSKSLNGGASWFVFATRATDFPSMARTNSLGIPCVHCPYDDNDDGNVVYIGAGANWHTTRRDTSGVAYTLDGTTWNVARWTTEPTSSDPDTWPEGVYAQRHGVETHPTNRNLVVAYPRADTTIPMMISTDGGSTWTRKETGLNHSSDSFTKGIGAAGGFPTDTDRAYIITNLFIDDDNGVFVSTDQGTTWVDKTGNIDRSDIGLASTANQLGLVVVPLWTE